MKVGVLYPSCLPSAWSVSHGIPRTLRKMGHDVVEAPFAMEAIQREEATAEVQHRKPRLSRAGMASHADLAGCDLLLVSGPEHILKYLEPIYPRWAELKAVKAAWVHETVVRSDYVEAFPLDRIRSLATHLFTPAAQDEKYGMKWVPFGVDCEMFCPSNVPQSMDVGFVGMLYEPRKKFLESANITGIRCAHVGARIGNAADMEWSTRLLAESYRAFKLTVNLPTLCQHTVTKVLEAMACGAVIATPYIKEDERNNFAKRVQYYHSADDLKEIIEQVLADAGWVAPLRQAAREEAVQKFSLSIRLQDILNECKN
jgi:hypothetical protein